MTRAALISLVALLAATGGANAQDHAPGVLRGARPGMASVSGGLTPLVAFSENSMGLTAKSLFVDMNVLAAQTCPATYTSCPDGVSCCLGNCCGGGHCCNTGYVLFLGHAIRQAIHLIHPGSRVSRAGVVRLAKRVVQHHRQPNASTKATSSVLAKPFVVVRSLRLSYPPIQSH